MLGEVNPEFRLIRERRSLTISCLTIRASVLTYCCMRFIVLSFISLASLGCSAEPTRRAQATADSAGVRIHTGPELDSPLPLIIERLGPLRDSAGAPYAFIAAHHRLVGTDSTGRVFALSPDPSVLVFEPSGQLVSRLGRRGNGPGELQLPVALTVSDATITVHDAIRRALVRWSVNSTLLADSVLVGVAASATTVAAFASGLIFERRLVEAGGIRQQLERGDQVVIASVTAATLDARFRCVTLRALSPLFAASLVWSANASVVAVSKGEDYVVDLILSRGDRRSLRRPLRARVPQRQDVERLFPDGMRISLGSGPDCVIPVEELIAQQGLSNTMPIVTDLFVRASGETWVQRSEGTFTLIDVFDEQGLYLGTTTDIALPVAELLGNMLLVPQPDRDNGSLTLQRLRLSRP